MPGAGAAGGLAGALAAYFGTVPESGIEAVIGCTGLLSKVSGADWIVTGEGRSDAQTMSGKVPAGVLRHKGKARVSLLSGAVSRADVLREAGFDYVAAVTPRGTPLAEALRPDLAERHLRAAVRLFLQENQ
jgi:glycerate kinase